MLVEGTVLPNSPQLRAMVPNGPHHARESYAQKKLHYHHLATRERPKALVNANQKNVFVKLSLFFNEPDHNQPILEQILEGQLERGFLDLDRLIEHLEEYCMKFYSMPNNSCRCFIYATVRVVTWCYNFTEVRMRHRNAATRLADLTATHSTALRSLLTLVCKPEFTSLSIFFDLFADAFAPLVYTTKERSEFTLNNLEALLKACDVLRVEHKPGVAFADMKLGFGETALVSATRAKRADTIGLLIKYGANPAVTWLGFEHCLEVLLFSPHVVQFNDEELEATHRCLNQILLGTKSINMKRLKEMCNDYHPIIAQWEEVLSAHVCTDGPMPLSHLCRFVVRKALHSNWSLPQGVKELPIPTPLKDYIAS